jgi:hypothetical protein
MGVRITGPSSPSPVFRQEVYSPAQKGLRRQQYDPCYHLACDTFANNSNTGLDQMSDAVAHAVLLFSKRNFDKNPLVDPPVVPSPGTGGGGLHDHDHEHESE